jgi:hypothetical protein
VRAVSWATPVATLVLFGCGDIFHPTTWQQCGDEPCASAGSQASTGGGGAGASGNTGGDAGSGGLGAGGGGGARGCADTEDCTTAADDDCSGAANETCPPVGYAFDVATTPDFPDEAHALATTGDPADVSGYATFALGQLLDGVKGPDNFDPPLEWVVWTEPTVGIIVDFGVPRDFTQVSVGVSNVGLYIYQPAEIQIGFSDDGETFTRSGPAFHLRDGSLETLAEGTRGDLLLPVEGKGRYLQITLVQSSTGGAEALDELAFE